MVFTANLLMIDADTILCTLNRPHPMGSGTSCISCAGDITQRTAAKAVIADVNLRLCLPSERNINSQYIS